VIGTKEKGNRNNSKKNINEKKKIKKINEEKPRITRYITTVE
jgi:hypothetical protein